jgi:hypothetical protein
MFQPSLAGLLIFIELSPGLASWAKFSRPFGTECEVLFQIPQLYAGSFRNTELHVWICGIPHLAKNERDVGLPRSVVKSESKIPNSRSTSQRFGIAPNLYRKNLWQS